MNRNARICIDNLGRLEDYQSMLLLLKKFTSSNICLKYEAFACLSVSYSLQDSSTKRVVTLLNAARGSCQNLGVHTLVEKCGRGLIEDARGIIKDMEEANCALTTRVYNCILSNSYKNGRVEEAIKLLEEMKEVGIYPDAITFEIIIRIFCVTEVMDGVRNILDGMVSQVVEPQLETHTAIHKSLCAAEKYKAAHKYVVQSAIMCKNAPTNTLYSLLAKLYLEKGNVTGALYTLELMDKGIKPNGGTT